jgi:hypothetical protein
MVLITRGVHSPATRRFPVSAYRPFTSHFWHFAPFASNFGHSHYTPTPLDSNGGAIAFEDIE